MFKRARPPICLQATLMGSVKARNKTYTLLDPTESNFKCLQTTPPTTTTLHTPCSELCKLMTDWDRLLVFTVRNEINVLTQAHEDILIFAVKYTELLLVIIFGKEVMFWVCKQDQWGLDFLLPSLWMLMQIYHREWQPDNSTFYMTRCSSSRI